MIAKTTTYILAGALFITGELTGNKDFSWVGLGVGFGSAVAHIGIAFDMAKPRKRRWGSRG
jgi:hypothetical protein